MSNCSRCQVEVPDGTVHIFSGGKDRAKEIQEETGANTILCRKPIILFKKSFTCPGCEKYVFDSIDPFKGEEGANCLVCGHVPWSEIHEM